MFGADDVPRFYGPRCEEAFRALYNMESYLRFMVRWELVGKYAEQWEAMLGDAAKEAELRRETERGLRKIDAEETILSYLTLFDLMTVILQEAAWPLFKNYFPPQEMFQQDFKLLMAVRNKNAHFRPIKERDLTTIRRWQEDMALYTGAYAKQRAQERAADPAKLWGAFTTHITPWAAAIAGGEGPWSSLQTTSVSNYLRIDLALKEGLLSGDVVRGIVQKADVDCFFATLDAASGRLTLYIPKTIGAAQLGRLATAARSIVPLAAFVEAEPTPDDARLDYVFAHDVRLPAPFKLSA